VANKMADKKKNASRPGSQAARTNLKTSEKQMPVKSISAMARDEREDSKELTKLEGKPVKSISAMARDGRKEVKDVAKQDNKLAKDTVTQVRNEPRKERAVQENKSVRRESREPAWFTRLRNSRAGRFVFDAYYELRHKVTWPTFVEARNMTLVVIVLSVVIGIVLAAVDYGLYNLFLLISGAK